MSIFLSSNFHEAAHPPSLIRVNLNANLSSTIKETHVASDAYDRRDRCRFHESHELNDFFRKEKNPLLLRRIINFMI